MTESTRGAAPIIAAKPKIVIAGVEYTMRRLGFTDINKLAPVLGKTLRTVDFSERESNVIGVQMAGGILENFENLSPWIASVLGISNEELNNPDLFPLSELDVLVSGFVEHPDWKGFIGSLGKILPSLTSKTQTRRNYLHKDLNS
jgi:hypothetical protein